MAATPKWCPEPVDPHQPPLRDKDLADAAFTAYLIHVLAQNKTTVNLHQLIERWSEHHTDDPPDVAARVINLALTRLRDARIIAWHRAGHIRIRNSLLLRVFAQQHTNLDDRNIIRCPVAGCAWVRDRTLPDQRRGRSVGTAVRTAAVEDDAAVRAHLETHPVDDFARTIAGLQDRIAELERQLDPEEPR